VVALAVGAEDRDAVAVTSAAAVDAGVVVTLTSASESGEVLAMDAAVETVVVCGGRGRGNSRGG
jgi:hypothetical protein